MSYSVVCFMVATYINKKFAYAAFKMCIVIEVHHELFFSVIYIIWYMHNYLCLCMCGHVFRYPYIS
jgi:hypothetical protein